MKIKNLILGLQDQLPLKRAWRNFFVTGNAWGLFSKNSHISSRSKKGNAKVMYNTKASAVKAAQAMEKKYVGKFRAYKCIFCDGYHVGKNKV